MNNLSHCNELTLANSHSLYQHIDAVHDKITFGTAVTTYIKSSIINVGQNKYPFYAFI